MNQTEEKVSNRKLKLEAHRAKRKQEQEKKALAVKNRAETKPKEVFATRKEKRAAMGLAEIYKKAQEARVPSAKSIKRKLKRQSQVKASTRPKYNAIKK